MHKLEALKGDVNWYSKVMLSRARQGDGLPNNIMLADEIGRGSNNRVYRGLYDETTPIVVRIPRRKSDTEKAGFAMWEFKHTLVASRLGVAPILYDSWYNRHGKQKQKAGLYMIQEYFPSDLMNALDEYQDEVIERRNEIGTMIKGHIDKLAKADMLCYDLKPGNIVVRFEDGSMDLKFIDFGREFCEHAPTMSKEENQHRTPVTNIARTIAKKYAGKHKLRETDVYQHLLYCVMTVVLSAITTYTIHSQRESLKANYSLRKELNFTMDVANELLDTTRGDFIKLVKEMLRQEDIKDLLRHYLGRRNSGTKRVMRFARGIEKV